MLIQEFEDSVPPDRREAARELARQRVAAHAPTSDVRRCVAMGATLETPAWLLRGISTYDAQRGMLRLDQGRLSFRGSAGKASVFDIALTDINNVKFPRYNLGSVVRFDAGGKRYRLAFLASERRFKWSGARISDFRPARRWGRQWKTALRERR